MKLLKYRMLFYVLINAVAAALALIAVYAYGGLFQHDRYWKGTIKQVQDTEIALLRNLLALSGCPDKLFSRKQVIAELFQPLDRKLVVTVQRDGTIVYTNRVASWELQGTWESLCPESDQVEILVRRYEPPSWHSVFHRWLLHPHRWFAPSFDFVTVPFLFFLGIFSLFLYALSWKLRATHLSKEVLPILHELSTRNVNEDLEILDSGSSRSPRH